MARVMAEAEVVRQRSRMLRIVAFGVFAVILLRLGWLQLARGGFYTGLSEDNYVQGFVIAAPRGLIKDRNGEILADNRPSLSISLSRMRNRDDDRMATVLANLLDLDRDYCANKLDEAGQRYYGAVMLVEDADLGQVSRVEERRSDLPGVKVEVTATRRYSEDSVATHAIGYVGEISEAELVLKEKDGYRSGEMVGRTGAEQRYESLLRGDNGSEYWVCNASGQEMYPFPGGLSKEAEPGNNLILTIDARAQRAAEEALSAYAAGAVVAIEPSTGEVLAMASYPAPDPNVLVRGVTQAEWSELSQSPTHPLLNRAIQAVYPPGSPFKLITAAAALETGVADYGNTVNCRGSYKYGIRTFRCWRPEGHGVTDIFKGIVESCDVFMYQLGAKLGVAELMNWAERSGLGRRTGIDISGEVSGNVPTPAWYDRNYGRRKWSKGVVINLSIGQGELLETPIQAACFVSAIANGGTAYAPHLLKRVESYAGRTMGSARRKIAYELPYSPATTEFLRRAMVAVVEAPNGTGKLARIRGIEVAGKTGTAQNPHGEDHAWFIAYAPASQPAIAVAVLVENAGGGGAVAAPVARKVMKAYLGIEDPPQTGPEAAGRGTAGEAAGAAAGEPREVRTEPRAVTTEGAATAN
ncbi:MAG: penicillin-binding protein 2 [Candidatus Eisenbacteria bacterium]|nr:penicillin-binding protein 2 [Candidatus Eisenbacteria bacterium]